MLSIEATNGCHRCSGNGISETTGVPRIEQSEEIRGRTAMTREQRVLSKDETRT